MSFYNGAPKHKEWKLGCKVYIGNLNEGASKSDIEDAFNKYGPLRNVWVARKPSGFAFVEFEDGRDAEDACRHLDGTRIAGNRIKAEMSHGRTRRGRGGGPAGFRGGPPPPPPPPYSMSNSCCPAPGYHGGAPPHSRGMYNGHENIDGYYSGHRGGGHRNHPPPPPPSSHPPPMHAHHGYMDRIPRGPDRHVPRPRSPVGIKEFREHYTRSRSASLDRTPPPPPAPSAPPQAQLQQPPSPQPQRTARPRTPPSRSTSPERH